MKTPCSILVILAAAVLGMIPISAQADYGYIGCSYSDNCATFDLVSYAPGPVIDLLPYGNYPYDATMTPDGSEVWITGASGDGVVVIDTATQMIVAEIPAGEYTIGVAFNSTGSMAFVTSRDGADLTRIRTSDYTPQGVLNFTSGYQDAGNIALDPVSGLLYVVDWYDDWLFEISADGTQLLRSVELGNSLWQLVVSPDGQNIYVTDRSTDQVRVIDRETLVQETAVNVGDDPWGIDVTADGGLFVVACEDSQEVYIVETATWSSTVIDLDAGADARDVDIFDQDSLAFVCGGLPTGGGNPIYVIDLVLGNLEGSFQAGGSNPNVIAVQAQMHGDGTGAAEAPALAGRLEAWPNPFNPETTLRYRLQEPGSIQLQVFDAQGRRVATLREGWQAEGEHELVWDGRDADGRPLSSGVYLARLLANGTERRARLVLIK